MAIKAPNFNIVAPTPQKSQLLEMIKAFDDRKTRTEIADRQLAQLKQNAAERMQRAKLNADALAQYRADDLKMKQDKFNLKKSEREQAKKDKEALYDAEIQSALINPMAPVAETTEEMKVVPVVNQNGQQATVDEYDTEKVLQAYKDNPNFFEADKVEEIKPVEVSEENKIIFNKLKDIDLDPSISDKRQAKLDLLKELGYEKVAGTEDSGMVKTGKKIRGSVADVSNSLANKILDFTEWFGKDESKRRNEVKTDYQNAKTETSVRDPLEFLRKKANTYQTNLQKNKEIENRNAIRQQEAEKALQEKMNRLKTGKRVGKTMVDNIVTPRKPEEVLSEYYTQVSERAKKIIDNAKKTGEKKLVTAKKIQALKAKADSSISEYAKRNMTAQEYKEWLAKEQMKAAINAKKEIAVNSRKAREQRTTNRLKAKDEAKFGTSKYAGLSPQKKEELADSEIRKNLHAASKPYNS